MKQILVIEDERIIADDIKRSLIELGYAVPSIGASGEDAIKKAAELMPDLVLMDIVLKGNIDGIKAASHIRNNFNIPVVYLTSHSDEATLKRAKETGPFGYLLKPFDNRELRTAIEMAIYSHKVERMLKESEQWLSITLKSIADGVIVSEGGWLVEFMNPVAEELTGWGLKDALGRRLSDVFDTVYAGGRPPVHVLLEKVFSEGVVVSIHQEMMILAKGGVRRVPVEMNAAPIKDEAGSISGLVLTFRDITERVRAEEERRKLFNELEHLSSTDRLTGLFNRGALIDRLHKEISRAARYGSDLSVILCDIDHFKSINDTYGHAAGDAALKTVSRTLEEAVRDSDIVGRYGGDEFMVILPETRVEMGEEIAERIRSSVFGLNFEPEKGNHLSLSLSLGLSGFRGKGDSSDPLMKRADEALYTSKRQGRNRITMA